jgi:transglutaminase-like putative cysteine protease
LLLIILLWAWIKPIAAMSGWTEQSRLLALFGAVGICVLLDMLRVPAAARVLLKGLSAVAAVGWLFRGPEVRSGAGLYWLQEYGALFMRDIRAAAAGEMGEISAETRTLVFLAGWILLAGVIQSILVYRRRALWLIAATWLYLLALQLWPGVDTTGEMIASGAAGTAMLCLLQLERIRAVYATGLQCRIPAVAAASPMEAALAEPPAEREKRSAQAVPLETVRWTRGGTRASGAQTSIPYGLYAAVLLMALVLFIAALAGSGMARGVAKPLDPGSWRSLAEAFMPESVMKRGEATAAFSPNNRGVTGYGEDDSRLGGPLTVKDEPVFTARTPVATYWRGESKSYYDGQGWTKPKDAASGSTASGFLDNGEVFAGGTGTIVQELLYQGTSPLNMLFAGGYIEEVEAAYTLEGKALPSQAVRAAPYDDKYTLAAGWGDLGYVRLLVRLPAAQGSIADMGGGDTAGAVQLAELQLPGKLPDRVRRLAEEISSQGDTPYAKAVLLEQYLKSHYRYSLTDAAVPREGEDFVDAFLFGEGSGYCDYFSTAMTVMLRSISIPARWVKGFAPGEVVAEEEGIKTVEVSSKDAHSWLEAYIPRIGWVPFDPTPGFLASAISGEAEPASLVQLEPQLGGAPYAGNWLERIWLLPDFQAARQWAKDMGQRGLELLLRMLQTRGLLIGAVLLTLLPAAYLLQTRGQLLAMLVLLRFRRRGRSGGVLALRLLDSLWVKVFRRYGAKEPGQTLREYAEAAGGRAPQAAPALLQLVQMYEEIRYAPGQPAWLPRRQLAELWRQLFGGKPEGSAGMSLSE